MNPVREHCATPRMMSLVCAMAMLPLIAVHAEQLFVADKLVLNVYSEPNQGGERVATLETGDAVEALERAESFVRVRLQDGREGWVGANYLSANAPALIRLRELEREQKAQKQSADEIARLRKQNTALQGELDQLKRKAATSVPASVPEPAAPEREPETEAPETASTSEPAPTTSFAILWAAVAVLTGIAGYALGYITLGRRVRKKFGGVKIY